MKYLFLAILALSTTCIQSQVLSNPLSTNSRQVILPYNRMTQPAGTQIYFGDRSLENHSLDAALSPDHKWLAVEERYSIVFISTADKGVRFVLDNDTYGDLVGGMNTYSGITWHN